MHPRVHPAIAGQHYRTLELKSRVESANPYALVALLYEELLRSIDLAVLATNNGASGHAHIAKASSIVVALETSLDFDKGGTLAPALARVYRACRETLNAAIMTGNAEKLPEIRDAVSSIAYAWQALSSD